MEKENKRNYCKAHLYGDICETKDKAGMNCSSVNFAKVDSKKTGIRFKVRTVETYNDAEGKTQYKDSFHTVRIVTEDKKLVEAFEQIAKDQEQNIANKGVDGYSRINHTVSIDGKLVKRKNEKDVKTYYNEYVIADSVNLDTAKQENEVRNSVEINGALMEPKKLDGYALMDIRTYYKRPLREGEEAPTNKEGNPLPYAYESSFIPVRISEERQPEFFKRLESGELKKGDEITVKGQMHNVADGITVDAASIHFSQKEALEEKAAKVEEKKPEVKAEAKPEKKAPAAKKPVSKKKGAGVKLS